MGLASGELNQLGASVRQRAEASALFSLSRPVDSIYKQEGGSGTAAMGWKQSSSRAGRRV